MTTGKLKMFLMNNIGSVAEIEELELCKTISYSSSISSETSVELIALLAISCIFFLFCMHTNKLNSRLKEMEMKLHPSEFSALGLTGDGAGVDVGGSSSGSNSNHLDSSSKVNNFI
uniref:Uncharacterized protein n=1 Tax=Glossina pallidipes TaxID=7398 RepID=A0A1A9ZA32_GLOPL